MAKRTAIIDIGSNSARLVIFQKTSKHGFHLICEQKSKVRIGEGAYEHGGHLQEIGLHRAFYALESFSHTIREFGADKTISVATSALRDAPNRELFLTRVRDQLALDIRVISGKEEALYGAIAANNLLPISDGITIDIGGGSSDMALIRDNKIIETYTLNLGTVRLKELFFDKSLPLSQTKRYIQEILATLPHSFCGDIAIGIGGTARTIAKAS
jgi:exopolyphosphatase/guanosine-5'-triphosphate,3'-diphosphate pyrophosphatase